MNNIKIQNTNINNNMATNSGISMQQQQSQQLRVGITTELRQNVIDRLKEATSKMNVNFPQNKPDEIEVSFFKRSTTKEDYVNLVQTFLQRLQQQNRQQYQQQPQQQQSQQQPQQSQQQQQMLNQNNMNMITVQNNMNNVGSKQINTTMMMQTPNTGLANDSLNHPQQSQQQQQMMITNNNQRTNPITINKMMTFPTVTGGQGGAGLIGNAQPHQQSNVTALQTNQPGTNVVLNTTPQQIMSMGNKTKLLVSNPQQFQHSQQVNQQQIATMQMQQSQQQQQPNQMSIGANQQPTMTLQAQLQQGPNNSRMMQPNQIMNQRMLATNTGQLRQINSALNNNQNIQLRIPRQQMQQHQINNLQQTVTGSTHMMNTSIGQQQHQTTQQQSLPILVLQQQQQPRQINTQQIQIQMPQTQSVGFQEHHASRMPHSTGIQQQQQPQQQFVNKNNQLQHVNTTNMQSNMIQPQQQQQQSQQIPNAVGNMVQTAQFTNQFGQQAQLVPNSGGQTLLTHQQQQAIAAARQQQQQVSSVPMGIQSTMSANNSLPPNDNSMMNNNVGTMNKGLMSNQILTVNNQQQQIQQQQPQPQLAQQQPIASIGMQQTQQINVQQQQQTKVMPANGSMINTVNPATPIMPANHHVHHHGSPVNSNFMNTGSPAASQLIPSPAGRHSHSIETPSPQNQPLNTPGSVPPPQQQMRTKEQLYQEKLISMQKYVEPLKEAMQKSDVNDAFLEKTRNLYNILTGVTRTTLEILERCEISLESKNNFISNRINNNNNNVMNNNFNNNTNNAGVIGNNMAMNHGPDSSSINKSRLTPATISLLGQTGASNVHVRMQDTCQPLLDAVTRNFRKPTYFPVAHKTFGPSLSVLNPESYLLSNRVNISGNYICYNNNVSEKTLFRRDNSALIDRRVKKLKRRKKRLLNKLRNNTLNNDSNIINDNNNNNDKQLPNILQGEISRLDLRFKIQSLSARRIGTIKCQHLLCRLDDHRLPSVPPIVVYVPENYPETSPICVLESEQYNNCQFFRKLFFNFNSNLRRMPMKYSFTLLLHIWERCIQQAMCSLSDSTPSQDLLSIDSKIANNFEFDQQQQQIDSQDQIAQQQQFDYQRFENNNDNNNNANSSTNTSNNNTNINGDDNSAMTSVNNDNNNHHNNSSNNDTNDIILISNNNFSI